MTIFRTLLFLTFLLQPWSMALAEDLMGTITAQMANFREGAGMGFQPIDQLAGGTKVKILGIEGYWLHVVISEDGRVGWVHGSLVKIGAEEGQAGSVEATGEEPVTIGRKVRHDNSIYSGEIRNGLADGQGTVTFPNGLIYIGSFEKGEYHGYGTFSLDQKIIYQGQYQAGQYHGQGVLNLPSGESYTGEFKDGMMSGQGKLVLKSGDSYEGEFKNSNFHGLGVYSFKDGEKMKGQWRDGKVIEEF